MKPYASAPDYPTAVYFVKSINVIMRPDYNIIRDSKLKY